KQTWWCRVESDPLTRVDAEVLQSDQVMDNSEFYTYRPKSDLYALVRDGRLISFNKLDEEVYCQAIIEAIGTAASIMAWQ
ncbi:hypothetical protein Tco_0336029, partial [Tanacetum coccineum]